MEAPPRPDDDEDRELLSTIEGVSDPEDVAMMRRLQARLFDAPPVPVRVGRFALLRVLGSGGMGVVHLGYDEVLDRRVAIKLIRGERTRSEEARARLLREAQAMARLSHANVVQVYEAGEHAGRVFVAMEHVDGRTLRQWLADEGTTRPWPERLRVLLAAGRGLAAAHRAGVIHRDFKPENVLLTTADEPKVGDFGLAGLDAPSSVPTEDDDGAEPLTRTGAVLGTPRYMAPEQLEAGAVDARCDQFAFCVVAYEALVGRRPFEGTTIEALTAEVTAGRVRPIPGGCMPGWLAAAILRGLSVDPERRFASMEALLDAMTPRSGRRGSLLVGAVGVALGLGALAWTSLAGDPAPAISPCEQGRATLADAWSPARRAAVEQAVRGTGLPYADDVLERIVPSLDAYARAWADGFYDACTADEAEDPGAPARLGCLEVARRELRLVADELGAGRPDAVRFGTTLVQSLPALERCRSAATASFEGSLEDPELWALLDELGRVFVLLKSGQYTEGHAALPALLERARALDRDLLEARVLQTMSEAAFRREVYEDAARYARESLVLAERTDHDELELRAWRYMSRASRQLGQLERAEFEIERAMALADRPTITADDRASLLYDRAMVLALQYRSTEALEAFEQALAAYRALSPDHAETASVLADMALTLVVLGQQARAIAVVEQAVALTERRLGPRHPHLALALVMLGEQYMGAGRFEDATRARARALEVLALVPDEQPGLRGMLLALNGRDLVSLQRFDEAERALAEAASFVAERLPPNHLAAIHVELAYGNLELDRHRYEAAVPRFERVLALQSERSSLFDRAAALVNLAYALACAGDVEVALARAEEARAVLAGFAPDSPMRTGAEAYLAEVDRRAGRAVAARAGFLRVLESLETTDLAVAHRVIVHFGLARTEPDPARARAHAERAAALLRDVEGFELERRQVQAWLEEHPPPDGRDGARASAR